MLTTNIFEFKTQQIELHKQAENYRLVKSLQKPNYRISRIISAIGRGLIQSGQLLINRTQAAH